MYHFVENSFYLVMEMYIVDKFQYYHEHLTMYVEVVALLVGVMDLPSLPHHNLIIGEK